MKPTRVKLSWVPPPPVESAFDGESCSCCFMFFGVSAILWKFLGWVSQLGLWHLSHINRAPSCILRPVFWQIFLSTLSFYKMRFHLDTSFSIPVVNFFSYSVPRDDPRDMPFCRKRLGPAGRKNTTFKNGVLDCQTVDWTGFDERDRKEPSENC